MDKIIEINTQCDQYKRKLICDEVSKALYERIEYKIEFINKLYVDICSGNINNNIVQGEPDDDSKSVVSIITVRVNPNAFVDLMKCINFTSESKDIIYQSDIIKRYQSLNGKGRNAFIQQFEKAIESKCTKALNKKRIYYTNIKFKD